MTPGCGRGDHGHDHCYAEGGGMEGQAPSSWQRKKKLTATDASTVLATSVLTTIPSFAAPANPVSITLTSSYFHGVYLLAAYFPFATRHRGSHLYHHGLHHIAQEVVGSFGSIPPSSCHRAPVWQWRPSGHLWM